MEMVEEIMFNPAPTNDKVSFMMCVIFNLDLLALEDHCGLQSWYEIMCAAGPELPTAFAVPVLPKVNPCLR
jgi:hypothetical protein